MMNRIASSSQGRSHSERPPFKVSWVSPWVNFWSIGLCCHLVVVTTIAVAAYKNRLPGLAGYSLGHIDLLMHFVLIGLLAAFLDGTLRFRPLFRQRLRWLRLAPAIVLTIAGVEEIAQSLSPHRTCSFSDFLADLLGIFLFSTLAAFVHQRKLIGGPPPPAAESRAESKL